MAWHRAKSEERESRSRSYYTPRPKYGIHPVLGQTSKKYTARFFQLKVGHAATGVFLKRIGKIETAECWWCGRADQSVEHLYTKCRKWRRERRILKKELKERGIGWQRRPESRWLANLLANEQAVSPLLNYLMVMDIGGREGEKEGATEKDHRADQEGEELLNSR